MTTATATKQPRKRKERSPNAKPYMIVKDVQPIRDLAKLDDMKWALRRYCSERDYIAFMIGINTGLRAGDLLRLTIEDVRGKKRTVLQESKRRKTREILLHAIYDELQAYIATLDKSQPWLFPSRKGEGSITVVQFYRQLNKAAEWANIESVGSHTCRKTFGYWHYKQYKDVAQLQKTLNHTKPEVTIRYIGIEAEEIENSLSNFKL